MPRNINEILKSWGENARKSPTRSDVLKSEVLSKLPVGTKAASSPRRMPWLSLALTSMAVFTLLLNTAKVNYTSQTLTPPSYTGAAIDSSVAVSAPNSVQELLREKSIWPWPSPPPVNDNREFIKTDYSANIRTRRVQDMTARIQTIVRGMNGRVDGASSAEKSGYLSFVIPANKIDAFKNEIRSLTRAKFYSEQLSVQNLLPQKQMIEQDQERAEQTLADLQNERAKLMADHNRLVFSYQSRINAINKELTALNAEFPTATPERQAQINARISVLQSEKQSVQSQLAAENKNYQTKLTFFDSQINIAEENLGTIKKQDQNLLDNVATVQGSISLQWISLWEIMDLYLPGPLLTWILGVLAITAYLWHRRRTRLIIP